MQYSIHPSVKQLLASDSLAEAQVLCGDENLGRQVSQVVSTLSNQPRPGSLMVTRADNFSSSELEVLSALSALVVVRSGSDIATMADIGHGASRTVSSKASPPPVTQPLSQPSSLLDANLKRLLKRCEEAAIPLIVVPGFGEPDQVIEDFRSAFLRELKLSSARLYSTMLSIVLEEGLDGLVETLSGWLNRPLVVESSEFKVLAARNMGATPPGQQKALQEEGEASLRIYQKSLGAISPTHSPLDGSAGGAMPMQPVKLGRRLVFPVPLGEVVAGYVSVMIRPQDDAASLCEYMYPFALACKVDFSHRLKDSPLFSVNQKTLLKDMLSGRALSAGEQERLERHFGFDLCDGLIVFAVDSSYPDDVKPAGAARTVVYPDDTYISCEVEGRRAFVLPFNEKSSEPWDKQAGELVTRIKELNKGIKVRLGAARLINTVLDLPDAYGEARQALMIGSMIDEDGEFALGYGELGIKRLLYLVIDHPELDRFLEETLSPLESYDEEWESELVDTLRVYLEHGANLNSTARALFIHRHTLRYRLEQIADILKVDIDSQQVLLNLQIAFQIRDMKSGVKKR